MNNCTVEKRTAPGWWLARKNNARATPSEPNQNKGRSVSGNWGGVGSKRDGTMT